MHKTNSPKNNPRPAQGQARRRPCRLAHPPRRLPPLSLHARRRAKQRDISAEAIRAAFDHGTTVVVSLDRRTVLTVFNVLAAHAA